MTEKPTSAEEPPRPNEGRLDSWKKIAAYLRRDVTTVQRWEKREGMPVHRQLHDKMGSVYGFRSELDAWVRSRSELNLLGGVEAEPVLSDSSAAPLPSAKANTRVRWALIACGALVAVTVLAIIWFERSDHFWRSPIAGAAYHSVTGFEGQNEAAAISRDGRFVAFLSDRGGRTDVWVTQIGSGQFHNLTQGIDGELINPSIRTLGFSPDGALVTFWLRSRSRPSGEDISIWSVPTLGGEPTPYLEGVAEAAWSPDGKHLAYHTPGAGDPLFVSEGKSLSRSPPILIAPPGQHSHFPFWAPGNLIYFIKGILPDQLDVWRVGMHGEALERVTSQTARLIYPVLMDQHTLLYLASTPDGSGPSLYGMDVERRVPHQLSSGVEQFTSLAASSDGRRLIATVSEPERTLWRVTIATSLDGDSPPVRIVLATGAGFTPRFGPDYLLYVAAAGAGESIWKVSGAAATQLWAGINAHIIGGPAISADGRLVAFSVRQQNQTILYSMGSDGSRLRIVSDALQLRGGPAWDPDGRSITAAAEENGVPHLFRIPLDRTLPVPLVSAYSVDPAWSPDGRFVIYSGPDVGTQFTVKAATAENAAHPLPPLELTRSARHLALLPGGKQLVYLQGEIQHKNLWMLDLETGATQQLTHTPPDFEIRDFDVSSDGREAILERAQSRSHVVSIDLPDGQ